jgi:hypothetical protein
VSNDTSDQRIEVQRGPAGTETAFPGGKANQILVITQGTGTPVKKNP